LHPLYLRQVLLLLLWVLLGHWQILLLMVLPDHPPVQLNYLLRCLYHYLVVLIQ